MKDAKSMYRGGDIVEACHCDFDSSKLLGLVCPFCNEAVYLRAGTSRIGKGKIVLVNPSFCHYPGSAEDLDCERRSISGEGRREIERIKTEKRGQRLELYNKHLWDMFSTCGRPCPSSSFLSFSAKKCKNFYDIYKHSKAFFPQSLWSKFVVKEGYHNIEPKEYLESLFVVAEKYGSDDTDAKWFRFRGSGVLMISSSKAFHQMLVIEICDFLCRRTSGFVFEKLVKYWLYDGFTENDRQVEFSSNLTISSQIFFMIACTPWEAQIERFSNPDRKAADEKYYALLEAASKQASNQPAQ